MVAATKHTFDELLGSGVFPSDLKDLGLPYFCLYTDYTVLKPWTSHALGELSLRQEQRRSHPEIFHPAALPPTADSIFNRVEEIWRRATGPTSAPTRYRIRSDSSIRWRLLRRSPA